MKSFISMFGSIVSLLLYVAFSGLVVFAGCLFASVLKAVDIVIRSFKCCRRGILGHSTEVGGGVL
jgi:hypothetical protein